MERIFLVLGETFPNSPFILYMFFLIYNIFLIIKYKLFFVFDIFQLIQQKLLKNHLLLINL